MEQDENLSRFGNRRRGKKERHIFIFDEQTDSDGSLSAHPTLSAFVTPKRGFGVTWSPEDERKRDSRMAHPNSSPTK
jgi:hypothetical protein